MVALTVAERQEVVVTWGCAVPVGFDWESSGMQLRRLLAVGLHGRRVKLGFTGERFAVAVRAEYRGEERLLRFDTLEEVSAAVRHMAHLPIRPVSHSVSRRRAGELIGQFWLGGC